MSVTVKAFDEYKAQAELKNCPKIVRDYVKLLKAAMGRQQELMRAQNIKICEQAAEISSLKTSAGIAATKLF